MSEFHPFDVLNPAVFEGQLLFTPCPATKGTSLMAAVSTLKLAGASGIITLMADAELSENGAAELGQVCQQMGLEWYQLPVADDAAPAADFQAAWQQHSAEILQRLSTGETLAIHCKGGSGRTGLIAAQIMLAAGGQLQDSIDAVQAIRPRALQHPAHVAYLNQIAVHQGASS
ncbi:MAG: tyrosine-protein phosphatase [Pseudomonadota bacterium]|nr:tyrosine-protein phosphatase [Pseudomonadota bacterium]